MLRYAVRISGVRRCPSYIIYVAVVALFNGSQRAAANEPTNEAQESRVAHADEAGAAHNNVSSRTEFPTPQKVSVSEFAGAVHVRSKSSETRAVLSTPPAQRRQAARPPTAALARYISGIYSAIRPTRYAPASIERGTDYEEQKYDGACATVL